MSALGLGLVAANSYFKEDDARKEREYVQAQRDAQTSLLPDRMAAERSGYQNTVGVNDASAQLRPAQTANAQTQLGLQTKDLSFQQDNQPLTQQIKSNQLQMAGLNSADELKQLPAKLSRAATQGTIDAQGQSDVVLGTLGQLVGRNDKAAALAFANSVAKQGNVLPNSNGMTFTDIVPVRKGIDGGEADGYKFLTSDGRSFTTPIEAIAAAQGKLKNGKYEFIHNTDGSVFAGDKNTGSVRQVYQGDTTAARNQHTPAEVQTMNWLMANKVAKDAASAWDMVRSAREKTRNSFIMDYVSKNAMPGQDGTKLAASAGAVYDQVQQATGGRGQPAPGLDGATSNTGANPTMGADPQIKSLLGLP